MRRSRTVLLGFALLCLLPAVTAAGKDSGGPAGKEAGGLAGWLNRNFGGPTGPKPADAKAAKQPEKQAAKPAAAKDADEDQTPTASRPVNQVDAAANERERELAALLRRQKVCLKLQEIALKNNDEELMRKAEQLDERAREIYAQRTAHLPCSDALFQSDEQTLEKHLGPATGTASGWSEPSVHQVPREQPSRSAAAREDQP